MMHSYLPKRFLTRIFLSLLLTGMIQVLLLGIVTVLFSNRMIEETYSQQSAERMERLVSRLNLTFQEYRELAARMAREPILKDALFDPEYPERSELSRLYSTMYRELSAKIEKAAIHLVELKGERLFSTHMLPDIYNPNSVDPSLETYRKLKKNRSSFPIVDSFINPRGERVALSLFTLLGEESSDPAYVIVDVNAGPLAEMLGPINADFFTDIYLMDNINYKFVSLYRSGEFGNFSKLDWRIPTEGSGILIHEDTLVCYAQSYPEELMLVGTLKLNTVTKNLMTLIRLILLISIVGLLISSVMAFLLAQTISRPVTSLVGAMKQMESGDLSVRLDEASGDEFNILFHGFNDMAGRIHELLDARVQKEKALRRAERHALQSQINPHFLYNTLNTINSLSKLHGIEEITTIVTQLGKLLRNAMDQRDELSSLEDNMKLVEGYLQIQKIRFGESFNWKIHIEESFKSFILPRLIIQPIVENAVIHGLEGLMGDRRISITAGAEPPRILVRDNGEGIDEKTWKRALEDSGGIGLHNVNKRLKLHFGEDAGLFYSRDRDETVVEIRLGRLKEDYNEA
jgi:two-component system sensor histidine kinase YesM